MDWNKLKIFLAVADNKGLLGAADNLGVSHTTVFRQLRALEADIGTRLFERVGGAYQLTDSGERLYGKVRLMPAIVDEAVTGVLGEDKSLRGRVVVTAPSSFAHRFFPDYIHQLHEVYPDIQVTLLVGEAELDMATRKADIAFRVTHSPPENLVGAKILSIPWGGYASKAYLVRHGTPPRRIEDLDGHHFIAAEGKLAEHRVFRWAESLPALKSLVRTDDISAVPKLVKAGLGLGLLPYDLGCESLDRCFTLELAGQNSLWVLIHPDLRKLERIRAVSQFLTKRLQADGRIAADVAV